MSGPNGSWCLNLDNSDPSDVKQKRLPETNGFVEEFMLLTNTSVAKKFWKSFPQTAVLWYVSEPLCTSSWESNHAPFVRRQLPPTQETSSYSVEAGWCWTCGAQGCWLRHHIFATLVCRFIARTILVVVGPKKALEVCRPTDIVVI